MVDKVCQQCGSTFYCKPSHVNRRKFCSKECQYNNRKTENRELKYCKNCGKEYYKQKSRGKYNRGSVCSKECQYELLKKISEERREYRNCLYCGDKFTLMPSKSEKKYCSSECRYSHMVGINNPLFIVGISSEKRGPHWQSIKRNIKIRDNNTCQHCNITEKDLPDGLFLHVHHVIPYRYFKDHKEANVESNLITLCPACHRKADAEIRKKELTKKVNDVKVKSAEDSTSNKSSLINLFQE